MYLDGVILQISYLANVYCAMGLANCPSGATVATLLASNGADTKLRNPTIYLLNFPKPLVANWRKQI